MASTQGFWPYSYDVCDAAAGKVDWSSLPGQQVPACADAPGFNRTRYGFAQGVGRGSPEIDLFEMSVPSSLDGVKGTAAAHSSAYTPPYVSQTLQMGPIQPPGTAFMTSGVSYPGVFFFVGVRGGTSWRRAVRRKGWQVVTGLAFSGCASLFSTSPYCASLFTSNPSLYPAPSTLLPPNNSPFPLRKVPTRPLQPSGTRGRACTPDQAIPTRTASRQCRTLTLPTFPRFTSLGSTGRPAASCAGTLTTRYADEAAGAEGVGLSWVASAPDATRHELPPYRPHPPRPSLRSQRRPWQPSPTPPGPVWASETSPWRPCTSS